MSLFFPFLQGTWHREILVWRYQMHNECHIYHRKRTAGEGSLMTPMVRAGLMKDSCQLFSHSTSNIMSGATICESANSFVRRSLVLPPPTSPKRGWFIPALCVSQSTFFGCLGSTTPADYEAGGFTSPCTRKRLRDLLHSRNVDSDPEQQHAYVRPY